MYQFLRVIQRGQAVEAVVGDFGHPQMRLARISRALSYLLLGQHHEQRRLAHLWQAYDSGFHDLSFQPSAISSQPELLVKAAPLDKCQIKPQGDCVSAARTLTSELMADG
jgi:hypothetical protein